MGKRKKRVCKSKDIPKNFVFLLILLTIVVSMAGTWIVLNAATGMNSVSLIQTMPETIKDGNVKINVNPAPKVAIATGQISMEIEKVK